MDYYLLISPEYSARRLEFEKNYRIVFLHIGYAEMISCDRLRQFCNLNDFIYNVTLKSFTVGLKQYKVLIQLASVILTYF